MGFYCRHSSQTNSRDYIATTLSSALTVGTTYTISFWLTSGNSNYYYGSSSSHFGVQLTMAPMTQVQHENIGGIPQADITANPWHTSWVFYSFTYVATSPYQYVTVGNFYNDASTTTTLHDGTANYPSGSYYFIDDLRIETGPLLPIELVYFEAKDEDEHVRTQWETSSEIDNDYFTIERSQDAQTWEALGQIDGAGNSNEVLNYSFLDENPLEGLSYYRLKQTDFHGDLSHSSVRSVYRTEQEIEVYPNPTAGIITIYGVLNENRTIKIFSLLGQDLTSEIGIQGSKGVDRVVLNLTNLPAGVYLVQLPGGTRKVTKL